MPTGPLSAVIGVGQEGPGVHGASPGVARRAGRLPRAGRDGELGKETERGEERAVLKRLGRRPERSRGGPVRLWSGGSTHRELSWLKTSGLRKSSTVMAVRVCSKPN